jgi:hypothetical protein
LTDTSVTVTAERDRTDDMGLPRQHFGTPDCHDGIPTLDRLACQRLAGISL